MINDHLKLSGKGLDLLKSIEVLKLYPYDDQTGKKINAWCKGATIGYGHLIAYNEWPIFMHGIELRKALDVLYADLKPFEQTVRKLITTPLMQQQFDALVIFAFNIGAGNFAKSSAVKLINDPQAVTKYPTLESAWKAWNKSQGQEMDGLNNRRACEWAIYTQDIYKKW